MKPQTTPVISMDVEQAKILAKNLFNQELISTEVGYMLADESFFFTLTDEPVMSSPSIRNSKGVIIPGKFKYAVESVEQTNNYPDLPDDFDVVELDRVNSLADAICEAKMIMTKAEIKNAAENAYWQADYNMSAMSENA